ncbi:peptidyl-prolyl cis-trans isomerase-like 2 [Halteromyces radiatus]|uniref:peptidyl-prolyl cis-trans isomerase-like 2 n=1 Tax=Halteromyces radiatus TaxID=101107 RepID=UPI00221EC35E|nr:peptidyl-prolyl cis-trans isomerase-like 2 [Halteromyces radiatus]KAI8096409.1 peptidyl-prolyl cis-trans isomerase-like 2 [Halteromyces radiatus]
MGKWTDKLYITHSEWSGEVGQHSASSGTMGRKGTAGFKRLPFYCCSLSLQPFDHPVCTSEGIVFDLVHIIPYIKKYGTNPVTGAKLHTKDLIKLHFHKNEKGEFYCPVTFKTFSDHTAIAAIKTTGNVYAYDTIERLNIKAKHWKDLMTDEPFTRKDIIMIQDPHNLENRDMSNFHYLNNNLKVVNKAEEAEKRKPINNINVAGMGGTAGRIYAELEKKKEKEAIKDAPNVSYHQPIKKNTPYNAAHFSTGAAAQSFTSTAVERVTVNEKALINEDEYMYKKIKTKAYVRIITNLGNLNIELYSDKVPRTCYNFIMLAKTGYYENVIFHRSIKNFMIQGGDPTGTGKGGESYFKQEFPDEIKSTLSHDDRGILSMANHGKDTNGSQFFITYRPCTHLDRQHTIFGRVVGGMEVLNKMESISVDDNDRPERDIRIKQVDVLVDPYQVYKERLASKLEKEANAAAILAEKERKEAKVNSMGWFGPNVTKGQQSKTTSGGGVGKYLQNVTRKRETTLDDSLGSDSKKIKTTSKGYGNFDNF